MGYISYIRQNSNNYNILDLDTNHDLSNLLDDIYNDQSTNRIFNRIGNLESSVFNIQYQDGLNYQLNNLNARFKTLNDAFYTLNTSVEGEGGLNNQIANIDDRLSYVESSIGNFDVNNSLINIKLSIVGNEGNISNYNNCYTNVEDQNIANNLGIIGVLNNRDKIKVCTQAEYDSIETPDSTILYIITSDGNESNGKILRVYNKGHRFDIVDYSTKLFILECIRNNSNFNKYVTDSFSDINFIADSIISQDYEITNSNGNNAYINIVEGNCNICVNSNYFVLNDLNNIFNGYANIVNADLSSICGVSDFTYAFANCTNLTNVNSPTSKIYSNKTNSPSISQNSDWSFSFYNCVNLDSVTISGTNFNNTFMLVNNIHNVYIDSDYITDVSYMFGVSDLPGEGNTRNIDIYFNNYHSAKKFVTIVRDTPDFFGRLYTHIDDNTLWNFDSNNNIITFEDGDDKVMRIHTNYVFQ